jgi:2-polyprenyl-6-methoxyphenol hydroxylase-like FAD-dependent oxidoreductase
MTVGRRVGANTALRDAMLLSHALTAVQDGRVRLLNAIAAYEAEITPRGFPSLGGSRAHSGLAERAVELIA